MMKLGPNDSFMGGGEKEEEEGKEFLKEGGGTGLQEGIRSPKRVLCL